MRTGFAGFVPVRRGDEKPGIGAGERVGYRQRVTMTLFIATSLDGFIAGPDDDLSWLFTDTDYGFDDFYASVDALIMGRGTYDVVQKLGKWPYVGKKVVVVSRQKEIEIRTPETTSFLGDLEELKARLEKEGSVNVWLVGGGELVVSCLNLGLIDQVVVSLHPVLLGQGVPLFPAKFPKTRLDLLEAESFDSGLVQLTYQVRPVTPSK